MIDLELTEMPSWIVFVGMGLGLGNTVCVVYVAEIAPPAIRGFLIATWPLAYGFGQLFSAVGLQVLEVSSHRDEYKRGLYSQFAFVGILMCFLVVMPESPCEWPRIAFLAPDTRC
jgi:MFS family permease